MSQTECVCVRRVEPADLKQLLPMLLDMGFVDDESALRDRFPTFCASADHPMFVAVDTDGTLLGYAALHDLGQHLRSGNTHRTVKLDDLYTSPTRRRRGVARRLMQAVEAWARSQPVRYVFWYANQGQAAAAYQAMGYRPEGSGQEGFDFYEDLAEVGVEMMRARLAREHPELDAAQRETELQRWLHERPGAPFGDYPGPPSTRVLGGHPR